MKKWFTRDDATSLMIVSLTFLGVLLFTLVMAAFL